MALLLLLGEQDIFDHLLQALDSEPHYRKQLVYLLLQFTPATHHDLIDMFVDASTSQELRADLAGILGMLSAPDKVIDFAESLSTFGISENHETALDSAQLALAQHALGGLLVGGQWNEQRLRELRSNSKEGSVIHELSSVLLGWQNEPLLQNARAKTEEEKKRREIALETFKTELTEKQNRISDLESDLDKVRAEHGLRGDELQKTAKEKDTLGKEKETLAKEKEALKKQLEQAEKEKDALNAKIRSVQSEKQKLEQQIKQLSASINP